MKLFSSLGSLSMLLGVAFGAFGSHGLKAKVTSEMLATWNTGVQYHLVHALGLILVGIICQLLPEAPLVKVAGWLLVAGTVLFSGSLYILVLSGVRAFGMIAPVGGLSFLVGWFLLGLAIMKTAVIP